MLYTPLIKKAIRFATKTHEIYQKQKRKGKDIAYITHPLSVGLILSLAGVAEEVVIAGILHDTIEDSIDAKKVTPEMIEKRFGKKVASLVSSVTEFNKETQPWEVRKQLALEHTKTFSHDSVLVKSADVLANGSELVSDYDDVGNAVFERFNAPKELALANQLAAIGALLERWSESPLAEDLKDLAKKLQMMGATHFIAHHPATRIAYGDYDENAPLECPVCHWKGSAKSSDMVDSSSDFCLTVSCPNCDKMLLVANYQSA